MPDIYMCVTKILIHAIFLLQFLFSKQLQSLSNTCIFTEGKLYKVICAVCHWAIYLYYLPPFPLSPGRRSVQSDLHCMSLGQIFIYLLFPWLPKGEAYKVMCAVCDWARVFVVFTSFSPDSLKEKRTKWFALYVTGPEALLGDAGWRWATILALKLTSKAQIILECENALYVHVASTSLFSFLALRFFFSSPLSISDLKNKRPNCGLCSVNGCHIFRVRVVFI